MKSKILLPGILFACSTLSFSAFSQVKIGSNPTTISTNANWEVEATNNKKVLVRKSDGSFIIENTPSGAATDSILTIDTAGNVRRRTQGAIQTSPYLKTTGTMTVPLPASGGFTPVTNLSQNFGRDITYDAATGEMTVTKPGIYLCSAFSLAIGISATSTTRNDNCVGVFINDILQEETCARSSSRSGTSATNTALHNLNAGDKVTVKTIYSVVGANANSMDMQFSISLYKVSEL